MTQNEFDERQREAIKQMREMNQKANNSSPKKEQSANVPPPKPNTLFQNLNLELPFANLLKDKDSAVILALLLILYGEKADKMLLFALIYILL